jgi:hypothetical protein
MRPPLGILGGSARGTRVTTAVIAASPPWWVVTMTGLLALAVSATAFIELAGGRRHLLFHANALGTLIHEAGHAITTCLTGGGVYCVRVTSPHSGVTYHWVPSRFSAIASTLAGYAMPSLAGLGAAALLHQGKAAAVLTLTVAATVTLLTVTRDLPTLACVFIVGSLAFSALYWGTYLLQAALAYVEAWLLLTSELGGVTVLLLNRLRGRFPTGDDAGQLAALTRLPSPLWIAGWFVLIGWCLWQSVPLLCGPATG